MERADVFLSGRLGYRNQPGVFPLVWKSRRIGVLEESLVNKMAFSAARAGETLQMHVLGVPVPGAPVCIRFNGSYSAAVGSGLHLQASSTQAATGSASGCAVQPTGGIMMALQRPTQGTTPAGPLKRCVRQLSAVWDLCFGQAGPGEEQPLAALAARDSEVGPVGAGGTQPEDAQQADRASDWLQEGEFMTVAAAVPRQPTGSSGPSGLPSCRLHAFLFPLPVALADEATRPTGKYAVQSCAMPVLAFKLPLVT